MFRLDQKGVSLPLVLAILGLVIANTYYFMDVEKSTKEQNIKRGAEIEDNSEKIRLATFLSDVNVCSSINLPTVPVAERNDVFGGKTLSTINTIPGPGLPAVPLKKKGINFLETAVQTGPNTNPNLQPLYGRGSLKLLRYEIVETDPANVNISKRYSLRVIYSIIDRTNQLRDTKKTKTIRLPLLVVFKNNNPTDIIETCFTEPDEGLNTVAAAVEASCQGDTALFVNTGLAECQHEQNDQDCKESEVLVGIRLVAPAATSKKQEYLCGHPENKANSNISCTPGPSPIRELLSDLQAGDKFVCQTTDPASCSNGQMFVMGASQSPNCVTYCAVNELLKKVDSSGNPTCIPRPKTCPFGQYTKTITKNGDITCEPYTVLNKNCSAGKVAREIDPTAGASATGDAALGCVAITKKKDCTGTMTETTFVQSLAAATLACKTF